MSDQSIDKLLAVCTDDSLSVVDAYTLVDGLAAMVRAAHEMAKESGGVDLYGIEDVDMHLESLATDVLAKLEAKREEEKPDGDDAGRSRSEAD